MPTIRIDNEVWSWLQGHARPFEDTPNSVLRRFAGLDKPDDGNFAQKRVAPRGSTPANALKSPGRSTVLRSRYSGRVYSGLTGRQLNDEWKVRASHALFHKDGTYYNHLQYFPGALFDMNGYVLFRSEEEYQKSPHLQHGQQLHVPGGISSMPGYVRMRKPR